MEIRNLVTFVKAAELQSFSRAAEALGYSQSAVTVQIRNLEEELEVRLFERIGKRVRLTENGGRFLRTAQDILQRLDGAKRALHPTEKLRGALRIASAESLLKSVLAPVLPALARETQGAETDAVRRSELEVCIRTGTLDALFEMTRQNEADLLFFLDSRASAPEWVTAWERRESVVFAAAAGHPLAREAHIAPERIVQEPFLLTEKGVSYRRELERQLGGNGLELRPFLETGDTELIVRLLEAGLGVSFLPEYAVRRSVAAGRCAILDVALPEIEMWSQLLYHRDKWVTPQMELFLRLLREQTEEMQDHSFI